MKVYVDELHIKNCSCCDFCYTNSQGCVCKLTGHLTRCDEPLEEMRSKCPLLSLSDYTKQVRKEVVQEIRNLIKENSFLANEMLTGERLEVLSKYKVLDILIKIEDQIQGE
jgi:hypothetical protein